MTTKQDAASKAKLETKDFSLYLQWMGISQWLPHDMAAELTNNYTSQVAPVSEDLVSGHLFVLENISSSQAAYAVLPKVVLWAAFAPGATQLSPSELGLLDKMLAAINLKCSSLSASAELASSEIAVAAVVVKLAPLAMQALQASSSDLKQKDHQANNFASYALYELIAEGALKRKAWLMLQQLQRCLASSAV